MPPLIPGTQAIVALRATWLLVATPLRRLERWFVPLQGHQQGAFHLA
jgi:hypothetical protein